MGEYRAVLCEDVAGVDQFREMFGRVDVPVTSPSPQMVYLYDSEREEPCYLVDFGAMDAEEIERVMQYLCQRYSVTETEALESIHYHGVPIRAEHVLCVLGNPVRKF